jgi:chromate transporter
MPAPLPPVSLRDAARVWARIGLLSFGGPAGQVALMHRELVEERRWVDEARFLHALNYCMLLPGPEAQQLATYLGWLLHRTPGALVAGTLFVLPGLVTMLALSVLYAGFQHVSAVAGLFFGLKAAVLAVVVEALLRLGRRALQGALPQALAGLAFVAIAAFAVPFPVIVVTAGLVGLLLQRVAPDRFAPRPETPRAELADTVVEHLARTGGLAHTRPSWRRAVKTTAACLLAWATPPVLVKLLGGPEVLLDEARFFSKAAVVTFGGAYAVLAWVAQQAVDVFGWLQPGEMLDGLGLAETTPGPLILVVQFVGFLGAWRHPGTLSPLAAGVAGALMTVWVTFTPCFLWVLVGGPYIEALRGDARLQAALSAITAAVVGVILNLTVWFALHVLFREVVTTSFGPLRLVTVTPSSLDPVALGLSLLAAVSLFGLKLGLPRTLALTAAVGLGLGLLR